MKKNVNLPCLPIDISLDIVYTKDNKSSWLFTSYKALNHYD